MQFLFLARFRSAMRKTFPLMAISILLALLASSIARADDPFSSPNSNNLNNSLLSQEDEFLPVDQAYQWDAHLNQQGQLVLHWTIAKGYYLYQERFKFHLGDGTNLTPEYSPGTLKYDELFERETLIHHDDASASFTLSRLPKNFDLKFEYQGCAEAGLCYPPQKHQLHIDTESAQVQIIDGKTLTPSTANQTTTQPGASTSPPLQQTGFDLSWFLKALLFAMLGGSILNLMPCVFPVLSIKVMSLAAADRDRLHIHGWFYTLGIVCCFLAFAVILLIARAGGEAIGWGFQLQSPGLIASLAYLFFVMGLSMSGVIHFGTGLMGTGQKLTERSGLSGSFFTGALAAVVASPCTAPFMATALGFALTQPALVCLGIFAALGFGMALPLLLLCYSPALAARLPKPGIWMENLKQFLAYPLYLSAVWLLWVYGHQTSATGMAALCIGAVSIAFGFWIYNLQAKGAVQALRRVAIAAAWGTAILLPVKAANVSQQNNEGIQWQVYSPQLLRDLRAQNQPVFVNLTADWCLTCLANERVTLHTDTIEKLFADHNVATLKGDWTNTDPQITALLQEYGRSGVPLYLWFPAGRQGKAEVLPQLLTKDQLIEVVNNVN